MVQANADFFVSESRTEIDLDFNHAALTEVVAPPTLARAVVGDNNEDFELDSLFDRV